MSDLSQVLSQAIVLPLRRRGARAASRRAARVRSVPRAGGDWHARVRGVLLLATGAVPDELVIDLIHQVGGRRARAVVLPVARHALAAAGERYRRYLQRFGMERTETVPVSTRHQADAAEVGARIGAADLVLVGGGHPELLLDVAAGSGVQDALAQALLRGAGVAFVGPAAEAAGEWALPPPAPGVEGRSGNGLRLGLGLLPGTLVSAAPHGAGRLAATFGAALNAGAQALLLDEHSSMLVRPGWQAEIRSGTVMAIGLPPAAAAPGRREPHAAERPSAPLGAVFTRVAPAGWRLDLAARQVLPPGATLSAAPPG